jgi:aspartate aminotransferase
VFQTLIDDGDEVCLLDPAWVSYEAMVKLANGSLARVDTAQYDFDLEPALDDLAATVSDDTELLVVNSPGNPHGAVYSEEALEGVRDLAVEHDITVISDEIYKEITYDDVECVSLGTLEGMEDRTITLNGFSKAYAMTGWRLGYIGAPEAIVEQAGKLHSHSVTCAVNFVQHAGVEALTNTEDTVVEMRDAFEERRDMLVDLFAEHGKDVPVPEGAFYIMLPVREDDQGWAEDAVEQAQVATVPGSPFGTPGYVRLSYAASKERLREAVERLAEADLL